MSEFLLGHEPMVRLVCSVAVFALIASGEALSPRRVQQIGRLTRWPNNLGVVALNTVLVRLVLPTAAVGFALLAEARGWGLLNASPCRAGSPCRSRSWRSISRSTCST